MHAPRQQSFAAVRSAAQTGRSEYRPADLASLTGHLPATVLAAMLDEVGHGVVLLDGTAQILHANHVAQAELDDDSHPLQRRGSAICARAVCDGDELQRALSAAWRGLRTVLMVGQDAARTSLAVIPLGDATGQPLVLLCFGKRRVGEPLAMHCFARCHSLTAAEKRVLEALCEGLEPNAIAVQNGVGIATVRTQIRSIRRKTEAADITTLVRMVARLPPMVTTLRPSRPM